MKVSVIIPAAGSGQRFGEEKQFKLLDGRPLLFHTLIPFLRSDSIDEVIVVVPDVDVQSMHRDLVSISVGKPVKVVAGGKRRQDSVKNGLIASNLDSQLICIHDAARPFVTDSLINKTINACEKFDGSVVAIPVSDTVKYAENEVIVKTLDRENIWLAQTPQTFNKEKLLQALDNAETNPLTGTDESVLMEAMGFSIQLVEGHPNNFKITTKDDWGRAEDFAARQTQGIAL